ncbi:hypothetical protein [Demequina lignilytica]|uniref:Uncharacterized protein n=1 Tax=Demequina lignilytica TaxID=3051663 RepID=A0AAW7M4M4_9MICO|nr:MULTISPECIES: hypothetical protein [unclassified Demequina]MDN4478170.1 hypothetical protein [Demequina sp. SYSU T00039-1]MDN4482751.1 hypothetical protein [Demequina sp. SYSU T0a273]MDN4488380.1 hypothetical protein [Demequina sp. SYSU T00039]MDN4490073.1 hypothetical protein [Demequina sp. SYSU T00068]
MTVAPGPRRRRGPLDVAFVVAFGIIGALQLWSLLTSAPAVDQAAGIARILVLPLALLLIGVGVARARRAGGGGST